MNTIPKTYNKYCNGCKKYQVLEVSQIKARKGSVLTKINRRKLTKYVTKGPRGKFSKTPTKSTKSSKKPHLLLRCTICNAKRNWKHRRTIKLTIKNRS